MGRQAKKNQDGYIQCKVCEKAFELKDPQFKFMFSPYINEELNDALVDFIKQKQFNIKLLKEEPFYQHLNQYHHCPKSRCSICHDKDSISLKLFRSRHQANHHRRQKHEVKEQMKGKTGFNDRIRKEVLRQTNEHIIKMMETQKDYILDYPTIEVKITNYKAESKDSIKIKTVEEKKKKKEEHYDKIKKTKMGNKHVKILKESEELRKSHGITMEIDLDKEMPIEDVEEIPIIENEFYKLEKKHLQPLGIYRPAREWEKLNEFIESIDDQVNYYFIFYDDSLYLEDRPFKYVKIEELEDPLYMININRETFDLVE